MTTHSGADGLGAAGLRFEREGPIGWCIIDRPEARNAAPVVLRADGAKTVRGADALDLRGHQVAGGVAAPSVGLPDTGGGSSGSGSRPREVMVGAAVEAKLSRRSSSSRVNPSGVCFSTR